MKKTFPKTIKIGSRLIGEDQPVYFIADVGANFDGDLNKAKELASAAKQAGADVVKFQSFLSSKIVSGKSFAKMQSLFRQRKTILLASHNLPAITKLCPRTLWLEKGKIKALGPSKKIIHQYQRKS